MRFNIGERYLKLDEGPGMGNNALIMANVHVGVRLLVVSTEGLTYTIKCIVDNSIRQIIRVQHINEREKVLVSQYLVIRKF